MGRSVLRSLGALQVGLVSRPVGWPVEPSRELMALSSIYASQAGCKVVGREARDLAAASFGGGSKLWRRRKALEAVAAASRLGSSPRVTHHPNVS